MVEEATATTALADLPGELGPGASYLIAPTVKPAMKRSTKKL